MGIRQAGMAKIHPLDGQRARKLGGSRTDSSRSDRGQRQTKRSHGMDEV